MKKNGSGKILWYVKSFGKRLGDIKNLLGYAPRTSEDVITISDFQDRLLGRDDEIRDIETDVDLESRISLICPSEYKTGTEEW